MTPSLGSLYDIYTEYTSIIEIPDSEGSITNSNIEIVFDDLNINNLTSNDLLFLEFIVNYTHSNHWQMPIVDINTIFIENSLSNNSSILRSVANNTNILSSIGNSNGIKSITQLNNISTNTLNKLLDPTQHTALVSNLHNNIQNSNHPNKSNTVNNINIPTIIHPTFNTIFIVTCPKCCVNTTIDRTIYPKANENKYQPKKINDFIIQYNTTKDEALYTNFDSYQEYLEYKKKNN